MEYTGQSQNTPLPSTPARPSQYFYLDSRIRQAIEEVLGSYLRHGQQGNLWERLCEALPLDRSRPEVLSRRVEGLEYAAEKLWTLAMESGRKAFGQNFDRGGLRRAADIRPISQYHYLRGSREPWRQVMTRRDGLHDPQTALLKLRRDVESLGDFILKLPQGDRGSWEKSS
jgi:hypothetical protein